MKIRVLKEDERARLSEFLYEAIYQEDGVESSPFSVIEQPDLAIYIEDFGLKKGDYCLVCETEGELVAAVWVRLIHGFGYLDNQTPEFALAVKKQFRQRGIGTSLMRKMLEKLRKTPYKQASLAVQKENYAVKMYQKLGFQIVNETEEEYIMIYLLDKKIIGMDNSDMQ